jgi:hypothetical protein
MTEIKAQALEKLEYFCLNNLSKYTTQRNFDNGPEHRDNVSELSKYISHRILDEVEVLKASYKKFSYPIIEKFTQEVLWRTYWKGWLEMRPQLWQDYKADIEKLKDEVTKPAYQNAIMAQTKIEPFNDWVKELKEYGYLHNHARMWFASIWIFTLNLPWQLGADFFLKHLLDGDPASNTLGWRWVAGLHSKGKHYLATQWNINKFSKKKYNNLELNEKAFPKTETKIYQPHPLRFDLINDKDSLLLFHNLDYLFIDQNGQDRNYGVIDFDQILKKENYSTKVMSFKKNITDEMRKKVKDKFNSDIFIKDISDLKKIMAEKNINKIVLPYLCCGYENDFISSIKEEIQVNYIIRDYDKFCWPFATQGFFKFKDQIPQILAKFVI